MEKMEIILKPMPEEEHPLLYRPKDEAHKKAFVGYLRGYFANEESFFFSWFDNQPQLKEMTFKREFDVIVNTLRTTVLKSLSALKSYCKENKKSSFQGNYACENGVRFDSETYTYAIRFIPVENDYNVYINCYVKELLR